MTLVVPVGWVFNPPQIDINQCGLAKHPARSIAARGDLIFGIVQKVGKKASPFTPLHPAVLAAHEEAGGMRERRTKASLTLRTVCADDAGFGKCATTRYSAPRRGLKGRLVRQQLCGEPLVSYGHRPINGHLSTLDAFSALAYIEWAFQEKDARDREAAKRVPGYRNVRSAGIKFDGTTLRNSDASIRAK